MKGLIFLVALLLPLTVYAGGEQEFGELLALEEDALNSIKPQEKCPGLAKFVPVAMTIGGAITAVSAKTQKDRQVEEVFYDDEKLEALAQIGHEIVELEKSAGDDIYDLQEWRDLNNQYQAARLEYEATGETTSRTETYYEHNYAPGAVLTAVGILALIYCNTGGGASE